MLFFFYFSAFSVTSNPALSLNVTLILSKGTCYSWTSLWISIQDPSRLSIDLSCSLAMTFHFEQIIPLSTDMCDVWVCDERPWSAWLKDFVTNMLPHTSIWLHTAASKRSGRRLQFHIYPSCLDFSPGVVRLCLNVFEQDCSCVCVSVCVSQHIITGTSLCAEWLKSSRLSFTELTERSQVSPLIWQMRTSSTVLFWTLTCLTFAKYLRLHVNA